MAALVNTDYRRLDMPRGLCDHSARSKMRNMGQAGKCGSVGRNQGRAHTARRSSRWRIQDFPGTEWAEKGKRVRISQPAPAASRASPARRNLSSSVSEQGPVRRVWHDLKPSRRAGPNLSRGLVAFVACRQRARSDACRCVRDDPMRVLRFSRRQHRGRFPWAAPRA